MRDRFDQILDLCLSRIARGETIEQCLADYPRHQSELETCLRAACRLTALPGIKPSEKFCRESRTRLMIRLENAESRATTETLPVITKTGWKTGFSGLFSHCRTWITAAAVLAVVCLSLFIFRSSLPFSHISVQDAGCVYTQLTGTAEVISSQTAAWQPAQNAMTLSAGDRIRTGQHSSAVLTFKDGSSVKLEAGTDLTIAKSEIRDRRRFNISLAQSAGKVWTHIPARKDQDTRLEISTPSSSIKAGGHSFLVAVEENGLTTVAAYDGELDVRSRHHRLVLAADEQTEVSPGSQPSAPHPLPPPQNLLTCSSGASALISVIDPDNSSTGLLPDGLSINQITGSTRSDSPQGQIITLRDPVDGIYSLVVRSKAAAETVNISLRRETAVVEDYSTLLTDNPDNGWQVKFRITQSDGGRPELEIINLESLDNAQSGAIEKGVLPIETTISTEIGDGQTAAPDVGNQPGVMVTTPSLPDSGKSAGEATPASTAASATPQTGGLKNQPVPSETAPQSTKNTEKEKNEPTHSIQPAQEKPDPEISPPASPPTRVAPGENSSSPESRQAYKVAP